jgi:hypothetical protein
MPEKSMYLVLKSTVASGQRINAGDVVELSAADARALLASGRVVAAPEKPKAAPAPADRSVDLSASDTPTLSKRAKVKRNAD